MNRFGRGVRRIPGQMNKLEARYAEHLNLLKQTGYLIDWWFDALKLRLAEKTFYTPDFLLLRPDNELHIHEVKGFWEDDARVKIKVAADKFPFRFYAVKWENKDWVYETF